MKAILVLAAELSLAKETFSCDFVVDPLAMSFKVANAVKHCRTLLASERLYVRVLFLVMFPQDFLVELPVAAGRGASV